ncbi:MAG: glutaminyl-peptide cyclotransferase [Dehalococcoidia bacterium]
MSSERKPDVHPAGECRDKTVRMHHPYRKPVLALLALLGAALVFSCFTLSGCLVPEDSGHIPVYTYTIVNTYPHDPDAFTQGLVFQDGTLYESTGGYAGSTLRRVDLQTGGILQVHELPDELFGEGITIWGNEIVQLTWKSGTGFVYDRRSFELLGEFHYSTEGWGITHDGECLIMSDGTSTLYFLSPETYEEIRQLEVFDNDGPVTRLNELEYIKREIYANVWQTDRIARISPDTGRVTGWIELQGLLTAQDRLEPVDVLNGIAYDSETERLFVTGKLWPKLFEIDLVRQG